MSLFGEAGLSLSDSIWGPAVLFLTKAGGIIFIFVKKIGVEVTSWALEMADATFVYMSSVCAWVPSVSADLVRNTAGWFLLYFCT